MGETYTQYTYIYIYIPSCSFGASFNFFRFRVFFRVSRPRSLQKISGTCLNASGVFVTSNLHMEMGKTIGQSKRSDH